MNVLFLKRSSILLVYQEYLSIEIRDQRGAIRNGQIEYQVTMEVFFKLRISDTGDE